MADELKPWQATGPLKTKASQESEGAMVQAPSRN